MKKILFTLLVIFPFFLVAQNDTTQFKPSVQFGTFLQMQGVFTQDRPQSPLLDDGRRWGTQLQIWRARLMAGAQLTRKTSVFMQTEILSPIGFVDSTKRIQEPKLIILDAQVEHKISDNFLVYAGMQLTGINRQGIQSPVTLMGLEFGWYQYPYNLFQNQALQNNFGRDLGVSFRGYAFDERLEIRGGVFRGRAVDKYSNLRGNLRLNYNFLDVEKEHYYSGTNLGEKEILAVGAGVDVQDDYLSVAGDVFADVTVGNGALTAQLGYMYLSGGGNTKNTKSFTPLVPNQNILFGELGYYFSDLKIQPYIKYEAQNMNISETQYLVNENRRTNPNFPNVVNGEARSNFNTIYSESRIGGGINYYISDFNCNLKLQYEQIFYGRFNQANRTETKSGGEIKLQLTCFLFK
ncbi:MAG: hypothetical protein EAZ06_01940 [Cytophagales bacterium]|nr:MAG: hypothetical protein EAZ06_01940 [Cytophagales bacterium]